MPNKAKLMILSQILCSLSISIVNLVIDKCFREEFFSDNFCAFCLGWISLLGRKELVKTSGNQRRSWGIFNDHMDKKRGEGGY